MRVPLRARPAARTDWAVGIYMLAVILVDSIDSVVVSTSDGVARGRS